MKSGLVLTNYHLLMDQNSFNYQMPVAISFVPGRIPEIDDLVEFADDFLLISTSSIANFYPDLVEKFTHKIIISSDSSKYPDLAELSAFKLPALSNVIGIGGGSVLDAAKTLFARIITNDEVPLSSLLKSADLIKRGESKRSNSQLVLVPTTFGTSSEITSWGTIWNWKTKEKHSISHKLLYADRALIYPELSATLPKSVIAETGLDVFSHALESYWNKSSTFITKQYSLDSIRLCLEYLPGVINEINNPYARTEIAKASMLAGMAFSQTRTAAAHAISYPLTLYHGISHGIACSITLGKIFELLFESNKAVLSPVLHLIQQKYGSSGSTFQTCFVNFLKECGVSPFLSDHGVQEPDLQEIADNSFHSGRSDNMIAMVEKDDVLKILREIL
ncbi:MAG: phosphonoacetaldehyde reductase [Proteobacteria bacterium]|nr:phosphonoacetaldehyde reductase [Pseudomonadota bacterium]